MSANSIRTISEPELREEVEDGRVSGGKAIETARGFELAFIVADRDYCLVSRRAPDVPRAYRSFEVLTAQYRTLYPAGADKLTYHFSEPFEPKPSLKIRTASKKGIASKKKRTAKKQAATTSKKNTKRV